jgi:ParB family chromosome partitioning protein
MQITQRKTADLIPYVNNARTHSEQQVLQIAASIKEFGFNSPVLVDGENGIIAGHGRVMAAKKLNLDEVPTIELKHLTKTQKKAYILADNRLALNSGWDNDLLALELGELSDDGFDLDLLGFDVDELGIDGFEADEVEMPELRSGDKEPFQQMTFTLHDEQVEQIKAACDIAKKMGEFDSPNENSNGNALARVCETYVTDYGNS